MPKRIVYIQYTNPAAYPPLEHSSRILADAGWRVLFLGSGAQGSADLRFPPHPAITVRQLPFVAAGWRQKLHYFRFALWIIRQVMRLRPCWVYASDALSTPVALWLSYLPGVKLIYHEHDSPTGPPASSFMRRVMAARRRLAQRAALSILPNEGRAALFQQELQPKNPVVTVWNCPRLEEVAPPREPLDERAIITLLYHGTIVPDRLPLTVINALANLPGRVRLRVMGYETIGHQGYSEELVAAARCLGVTDRLEIIGSIPYRQDLLQQCSACDIGLAFMPLRAADVNLQEMVGASNKPFDYLANGLALLVSDLPLWRDTYVAPGYGLACRPDDAESVRQAVTTFLERPESIRAMGERGRQRILAEWHYEKQFAPVLAYLNAD